MKEQGVITESQSSWASPIVIVKKKDGGERVCLDYRKLNKITTNKNAFAIPRIEDILFSLGQTKYFSSLDLLSGYWQVEMDENDKQKTAFSSYFGGLYQFEVMPMGLVGSGATFQRLLETIFRDYLWRFCFVYIDDVLIASITLADHFCHLRKVFQCLRKAGLKVQTRKSCLLRPSLPYLGHIIPKEGIQVDPAKTEKVIQYPTPKNPTEIKVFNGLASY
ncbi:MAG: RNA-directed DNA polymerase, partial [Gammaproteobacteria bacterium]|nr:RNA-directed DNA polymerase [Gammaproteobacteria bacterium]